MNNIFILPWREAPRFSCTYKIAGTESFRLASTSILGTWGDNAQNKSKDLRYCWIADDGKKLGQLDQAGAEAMIVAYECNPQSNLRKLFNNGIKIHSYCAANIFRDKWRIQYPAVDEIMAIDINDVKKHPIYKPLFLNTIKNAETEYFLGKKTIHGANYDMRGNTYVTAILEETDGLVNISPRLGDKFLDAHHKLHPEIKRDFHNGIVSEASCNNCIIRNLFGYPREFTGIWNDKTYREMYAFKPQSTVGSITNLAITEICEDIFHDRIPHKDWMLDILQNGHDSILYQFRDDTTIEKEVAAYIKPHLEREMISKYGEKFNMKSELATGYNWGSFDIDENPRGLKEYVS